MKLFYALGGGLGHLCRTRTFIDQFAISDYKLLTNNPQAGRLFSARDIVQVTGETKRETAQDILRVINSTEYEELYVDAFPAGLFGELEFKNDRKTHYIARRLNWNVYEPLTAGKSLYFDQAFCFEELESAHEQFLNTVCSHVLRAKLEYPKPDPDRISRASIPAHKPVWLVVHSFVREEVELLVRHATEVAALEKITPAIVVLTDQQIEARDVYCYSYFPAHDWFPLADRIFTAGGFNALQQAAPFSYKTTVVPFPRKYDDQFWRARNFRQTNSHPDGLTLSKP